MAERCAAAGVAFVLVPEIEGAAVSGATKWLTPSKAMICMTLRGKCNDRFWFTFFHESSHILNDSKKEVFVDVDYSDDPREKAADAFAANLLIPTKHTEMMSKLKTRDQVEAFAAKIGIHPGIVVGRLQKDGVIKHNVLNELKTKMDWGQVRWPS